jgi:hypothetical protein
MTEQERREITAAARAELDGTPIALTPEQARADAARVEVEEQRRREIIAAVRAELDAEAATGSGGGASPAQTPEQIRAEVIRQERDRRASIRKLAGTDIPADLLERADAEGWTVDRATAEFLAHLQGRPAGNV